MGMWGISMVLRKPRGGRAGISFEALLFSPPILVVVYLQHQILPLSLVCSSVSKALRAPDEAEPAWGQLRGPLAPPGVGSPQSPARGMCLCAGCPL